MEKPDLKTGRQEERKTPLLVSPSSLLLLIVFVYLLIGLQYAALTPRWQVPDEPAHYNYIRELVEKGALPVLDPGEYQQGYLGELTSQGFPPELSIDSLKYESWQPPLYYLLAAPIFLISNGDLLALRLFSLTLGAGVIVFTFLAVREAVPDRPHIALTAAGFMAFIPQHIAMMAGINNDSLSELLIAIGLWLIIRINNRAQVGNWDFGFLGFVLALALVTKSQAYLLVPVAALMLLLRWRNQPSAFSPQPSFHIRHLSFVIRHLFLIFLPALLLGSLWWGRNIAVYGWPDFMAAIRHDQVVSDQPRTADWVAEYGAPEVIRRFFQTTFQSFWGQFGWMGVVMPEKYYWALGIFTLALVIGYLLVVINYLKRNLSSITNTAPAHSGAGNQLPVTDYYLLAFSALLTLGLYLYYNLTYVQHQGRYLFPALVPLSLAASVSLWWWGSFFKRVILRLAQRAEVSLPISKTMAETLRGFAAQSDIVLPIVAILSLAAFSLFALYRIILPGLA